MGADGTHAPLLRSLHLRGMSRQIGEELLALPNGVQQWVSPRLDDLRLQRFHICWDSPLLQSCASALRSLDITFQIRSMNVLPRPQIEHMVAQLAQMRNLTSLSLRHSLPHATPEETKIRIPLPQLKTLTLAGSVAECQSIWRLLAIPQTYQVSLECVDHAPADDVPALLPLVKEYLCGTAMRGRNDTIRCLSVSGHGCGDLTFEFWLQSDAPRTSAKPRLSLFLRGENNQGSMALIVDALKSFLVSEILPSIHSLQLRSALCIVSGIDWAGTLGAAANLRSLVCHNLSPEEIALLLSQNVESNATSSTGTSNSVIPIWGALEDLRLEAIEFYYIAPELEDDDGDGEEAFQELKASLLGRRNRGAGPEFLMVTRSPTMSNAWYQELKEVVPTVEWDRY